jgi:prepilin-type N-terminal cleavage/methylation domain-containing protein
VRRAGFTLLEAVVSLAIIGIVSIGALEAFAAEARAARQARLVTPAVAVAAEQLARLELLDALALAALPDTLRAGRMNDGADTYEWRASVARVSQESDLFALHVEVQWSAGSYALTTHAYRPKPVEAR